ncbi:MAG TPA: hypothetical protein VHH34_20165, partial [Pseudonocardiaceae bacterium]|nr:hypothetical protein [Pseudonocardiaceae bacterium]
MRLPARRCRRVHIAIVAIAVLAAVAVVTFPVIARAGAQQGAENGAATGAGDTAWFAGLSPDWDDTNVRSGGGGLSLNGDSPGPASTRTGPPQGMLLTAAHRLAEPRNQVVAELVADQPAGSTVAIDVRGTRENGSWTEWVPASTEEPAVFDAAVMTVQTRVLLRGGDGGASPRVRSVRLSAHTVAQTLAAL